MYITHNFKLINKICSSCKNVNWQSLKMVRNGQNSRFIHTSTRNLFFHEPDPKYEDKMTLLEHFRNGLSILKDEVKVWKSEVIETIENDPYTIVPGAVDKIFTFDNVNKLDQWVVTSDSDHNNGYSTSELIINEHGKGVFQGILNTEVPSDGKLYKTGYCNLRSVRPKKSFQRDSYYDWSPYTYLVFRVRGDGRPYIINLATPGYYDIMWNDIFQYVLHTRGGPYWQTTKIPFSKFILSSKGKIQDLQFSVPLGQISNVGLTMSDKTDGPFKLEIDYIGIEYDPDYEEDFAYEMYKTPRNVANS